jgi:hypothetical protein
MISATYKKRLATALAGAALASALAVSGASADPHAIDAASRAADAPAAAPPPPSSIAASAGDKYQDLRAPDTRDQAEGYSPTLEPQPVAGGPSEPTGFDLVSAAIGAVAAGALSLVLMATLGLRRSTGRRPASA